MKAVHDVYMMAVVVTSLIWRTCHGGGLATSCVEETVHSRPTPKTELSANALGLIRSKRYSASTNYDVYDIEKFCHHSIIADKGNACSVGKIQLRETDTSHSIPMNTECHVDIEAPSTHFVAVKVSYVDIPSSGFCTDYLEVFIPNDKRYPDYTTGELCGHIHGLLFDSIPSNKLRVKFHSAPNSYGYGTRFFQVVFTVFNYSSAYGCGSSDLFRCSNDRCIWKHLRCDNHDNCGDLSDEYDCYVPRRPKANNIGTYIGVIVGAMFILIVCLFILIPGRGICGLRFWQRRQRDRLNRHYRRHMRTASNVSTISGSEAVPLGGPLAAYNNPSFEVEMPPSYEEAVRAEPGPFHTLNLCTLTASVGQDANGPPLQGSVQTSESAVRSTQG